MRARRAQLRNALLRIAALTFLWALVVMYTGGFVATIGALRVSSRSPRNSLIIMAVSVAGAIALSTPGERRRALPVAWAWLVARTPTLQKSLREPSPRLAAALAGLAAAAIFTIAMREGSIYASGADVYGYVSQADRWLHGDLRFREPLLDDPRWRYPKEILAPLGYRLMADDTLVPTYAPGLPLTMALFQLVGGPRAVFYVVPLMAALLVWATYVLGTRYAGRGVGLAASLLMASSPVFLFQIMFAMSDVPVAAWWTLAFGALLLPGPRAAFLGGLAASAAILTRPNLVPLALVPGALLVLNVVRERSLNGPAMRRTLAFAAGVVPGCIAVGVINYRLYDSPFESGYGDLNQYYSRANIPTNARQYPAWLLQTQTMLVLLAFAAPFLPRRPLGSGDTTRSVAWMWIAVTLLTIATLLPYIIFDHWFYLRLVLSVFPLLFVLMSFVIMRATSRLPRILQTLTMTLVVCGLTWRGAHMAYQHGAFVFREGERKSQAMGEYIARTLPENAALISMQHSGTARYYSGRLTVRWDFIWPAHELDAVIETLHTLGYRPYILLEDWEVPQFRERFTGASPLGALDWPPAAWLNHASRIYLYDPADRSEAAAGRTIRSRIVF